MGKNTNLNWLAGFQPSTVSFYHPIESCPILVPQIQVPGLHLHMDFQVLGRLVGRRFERPGFSGVPIRALFWRLFERKFKKCGNLLIDIIYCQTRYVF